MATHHVFCDESHLPPFAFRVQGGIWVPEMGLRVVRREFASLKRAHPQLGQRELGWSCVSGRALYAIYKDLLTLFFHSDAAPSLSFNCLVVGRYVDPSSSLGRAGRDLGFYKAYWLLLAHRLDPACNHILRLDEKTSPSRSPHRKLMDCLNGSLAKRGEGRVLSCEPMRSKDEDLLQLADVMCGAVGWAWNGKAGTSNAKREMGEHLAMHLGLPSWDATPTARRNRKFNIWEYQPRQTR